MESGSEFRGRLRHGGLRQLVLTAAALAMVLTACAASWGATGVLWDPPSVTVAPGEQFDLSFRASASGDSIASFQLYMSFDPSKLELVQAIEGSLYVNSGFMTWFIHEEESPGFYHLFDTVFGVGSYVPTPGELVRLRFEALEAGHSQAHVDTMRFTNAKRDPLAVAWVEHADIFIVPATGADEHIGGVSIGPARPNPFRSETEIGFSLGTGSGSAVVEIYDVRGRLVRRIPVSGTGNAGALTWDGTDDDGFRQPAGAYFVRLDAGGREATTKIVRLH